MSKHTKTQAIEHSLEHIHHVQPSELQKLQESIWDVMGQTTDAWQEVQASYQRAVLHAHEHFGMLSSAQQASSRFQTLSARLGSMLVQWIEQGGDIDLLQPVDDVSAPEQEPEESELVARTEEDVNPDVDVKNQEKSFNYKELDKNSSETQEEAADEFTCKVLGKTTVHMDSSMLHNLEESLRTGSFEEEIDTHKYQDLYSLKSESMFVEVAKKIGRQSPMKDLSQILSDVGQMQAATTMSMRRMWDDLSEDVCTRVLNTIVARTRATEEKLSHHPELVLSQEQKERIQQVYDAVRHYIYNLDRHIGFVNGLQPDDRPEHTSSWIYEGRILSEELASLRNQYLELPAEPAPADHNPELALYRLKCAIESQKIRDIRDEQAILIAVNHVFMCGVKADDNRLLNLCIEATAAFPNLPEKLHKKLRKALNKKINSINIDPKDDQLLPPMALSDAQLFTLNKRVTIVGGDSRHCALQHIEDYFQPEQLEWVESSARGKFRHTQTLSQRIGNHHTDLVLVIKDFVSHKVSNRLFQECKQHNIPIVLVQHGYGTTQIEQSMLAQLAHLFNSYQTEEE